MHQSKRQERAIDAKLDEDRPDHKPPPDEVVRREPRSRFVATLRVAPLRDVAALFPEPMVDIEPYLAFHFDSKTPTDTRDIILETTALNLTTTRVIGVPSAPSFAFLHR
jgi:hypothetical protein